MNERIAELLAKLDIDLYTDEGVMMTKILVSPKDLRQFAELIVKECAEFANEHNEEVEGVTLGVGQALKKHFGLDL